MIGAAHVLESSSEVYYTMTKIARPKKKYINLFIYALKKIYQPYIGLLKDKAGI